jgi:UDP-glucose 6-dehydrogenase
MMHPTLKRNIVGVPSWEPVSLSKAKLVHSVLPIAAVESTVSSTAAELVKYAGNAFLYMKVVFANVLYDLTHALGAEWGEVASLVGCDPRIGSSHMNPVKDGGRGAGGHCFIKDFAALRDFY